MRISDWSSDVCSSDLRSLRAIHFCDSLWGMDMNDLPPARAAATLIIFRDREDGPAELLMMERSRKMDLDRKSVVSGKSVSVRVDLGGRRILQRYIHTITSTKEC